MQDLPEMRWLLDSLNPFTDRRINDRTMSAAERFASDLLRYQLEKIKPGQAIDSAAITATSIELAKAMVAGFVEEKLI